MGSEMCIRDSTQLGLTYEPALFVIGADGRLSSRLDNIFDQAELRRALAKVTA